MVTGLNYTVIPPNYPNYPYLKYTTIRDDFILPEPSDLTIGGSWTHHSTCTNYFLLRKSLFEDYIFPYDLSTRYFRTSHNILLWGYDKLNHSVYTQNSEPNNVYFRIGNNIVARMTFAPDVIYLTEKIEPTTVTESQQ